MSRSAIMPLHIGVTPPEALTLLHKRLLLAEEEAEALIQDVAALGVSRDQILGCAERRGTTQQPVSPLKMHHGLGDEGMLWKRCDSLLSRVCRMESLLQTLKLTIFRLETERELDPSHTANLKQQLAVLQQESEEEQHAFRREVMKLRDQLQQAYQERDEACLEVQRLRDTVEAAAADKMDVALAAEELKMVKSEMSQKLMEMKEQMRQESARSVEDVKSHSELLQRLKEMERVVEMERRQALLLQSQCQALDVEVRTGRQQLEEEKDRGRQLEEHCQQLNEQTAMKDSLVSELKTELKSFHLALQRQQMENSKLLKEGRELRAAADRVQILNKQLQSQSSKLSSALWSLTMENGKQERNLVVAQLKERDLLLEAAGCSIQTELQVALTHKNSLQLELEKLRGERAQLLQSSSTAQETAVTQRKLLERTIDRLQGELSTAKKEGEVIRIDLEGSKNELCLVVTKLEDERRNLEAQLSETKREVGSLSSALQSQQDENRRLMKKVAALEQKQHAVEQVDQIPKDLTDKKQPAYEKGRLQITGLEGICGPKGSVLSQTLENMATPHTRLQLIGQTLQQEVGGREQEMPTLRNHRLQAHRHIRKHQTEVEKLRQLLTLTQSDNNRALESMQKALDAAKVDNKKLTQSVEQAVLTNSTLHRKVEQDRERHQASMALRDKELREARTKISHLSEELSAVQQQTRNDCESSMKTLCQEISELKMTVKNSSTWSGELSKANQELLHRVSELERQMSKQKACMREKRRQLRQTQKSRDLQQNSQKAERFEKSIGTLQEKEDSKLQEVRMDSQVLHRREAEWERWISTIQRSEAKRGLAHIAGGSEPARTQLITQSR